MRIIVVLAVLGVLVAIPCLGWEAQVSYMRTECSNYHEVTGREVKFERPRWGIAGCYTKTDKGWFTLEQIRGVE